VVSQNRVFHIEQVGSFCQNRKIYKSNRKYSTIAFSCPAINPSHIDLLGLLLKLFSEWCTSHIVYNFKVTSWLPDIRRDQSFPNIPNTCTSCSRITDNNLSRDPSSDPYWNMNPWSSSPHYGSVSESQWSNQSNRPESQWSSHSLVLRQSVVNSFLQAIQTTSSSSCSPYMQCQHTDRPWNLPP